LTYWYGVDAGALPLDRQIGLLANLPRVQSQDRIFRGDYDPADYEGVHSLYLEAYGDEDLADRARLRSMQRLVREETEAARLRRRG
jgi:hypothetical protein